MMKKSLTTKALTFIALAFLSLTYVKAENKPNKDKNNSIINITAETYKEATSQGVVLVDYWATWCGPCKKMEPILKDIAREGKVKVVKLDVDKNKELISAEKVSSIPTMVIYKDGKEVKRLVGFYSKKELSDILYPFTK